ASARCPRPTERTRCGPVDTRSGASGCSRYSQSSSGDDKRAMRHLTTACRGIHVAVRAHPWSMAAALILALTIQILLPPVILSLVRKPWTYFAFNPWLKRLPDYLVGSTPFEQKLDF